MARRVPSDPELDVEEGLILLKLGRWQDAEPLLNRAFAARPKDENVLNALGLLAWEHKRNIDEAERYFTRALAIHTPKDDFQASLHNNLGGVYGDLQQFPLALKQFESAVAISPEDAEYHTNLAVALAEMNRYEEAAVEIKIALRIAPDYPPALRFSSDCSVAKRSGLLYTTRSLLDLALKQLSERGRAGVPCKSLKT